MSFPTTLSAGNLTTIRQGRYSAVPRLLVNPNDIVFQAQVNQAVFGVTLATITFDNVVTGVIADALDGFTVYIGDTTDIRKASFVGRIRAGSSGTTLNINENSNVIEDDQFIVVVKDVAIRQKLGRYENKVMKVDWDITFRQLLPRVTGLDSCYVGVLASAIADFTFPAVGNPTTTGSTISSWLWDADGGSFINGTVNTDAQPDIRYTVAGVYWPRVHVTDSGGRVGWFTMPVFVCSTDLSDDFIVTGLEGLSISAQMATGQEMRFNYFSDELDDVVKQSFVALWVTDDYAGDNAPILNQIAFVGRMRKEDPTSKVDDESGVVPDTPFICEGVLAQMERIRAPQIALSFNSTPTQFQEIDNLTQWRCASFILTEFSTVANVCSLSFDIEDSSYLNREDGTDNTNLLAGINGLLSARKAALNQSSTGQLFGARNANFMTTIQRNALDIITTFTTNDRFSNNVSIDQVNTVGQITAFAGAYNSTDNTLRTLRAIAPAVASDVGQGIGAPVNGILLNNNTTLTAQKTEIEQIVADALADANPKDQVKLDILDGYWFLMPANFQWYGMLMAATENNRGIAYTASDRFLLTGLDLNFDNDISSWTVAPTLVHETRGGGAQTISQVEPTAIPPALPTIPTLPAYPSFPPFPSLWIPEGSIIIPPMTEADGNPEDRFKILTERGDIGIWWDTAEVYVAINVAISTDPDWLSKFTATAPMDVIDAKFDPHSKGAYVLVNDGAGNSQVWYTANVFQSIPTWTENTTTLADIDYTTLRTTATPGEIYIFGIDDRVPPTGTINLLDGDGQGDLIPSNLLTPHASSNNAPGVYSPGLPSPIYDGNYNGAGDWFIGQKFGNDGMSCNIEFPLFARSIVDELTFIPQATRTGNPPDPGVDRLCQVSIDGVSIGGTHDFGAGSYSHRQLLITKGPGLGLTGSSILFHASIDRNIDGFSYVGLVDIQIKLTDSGVNKPAFRYSDDYGDTLGSLKISGAEITTPAEPGFDTGAIDTFAYLGADDIIRQTDDFGEAFANKTDSGSANTYAKAIWSYGKNSEADMIFATDAPFGGITMARIVNDVASDITPNDGVDDGLVIGRNGICMSRVSDQHMWFVGTFNVTTKFAYTDDGGASYTISAEGLTTGASYIRVKDTNTEQVYIIDTGVLKYSEDGGASFLADRTVPSLFGIGFEVR